MDERTMSEARPEVVAILAGELGAAGRGTLGKEISLERAHELIGRIPEFMIEADPSEPWTCMDGRGALELLSGEASVARAKTAGGDLYSIYLAQELTDAYLLNTLKREMPNATPKELLQAYQDAVFGRALRKRTGAHMSNHAHAPNCGCGMCDGGPKPLQLLVSDSESGAEDHTAQWIAASMSLPFDAELHTQLVVPRARTLQEALITSKWQGEDIIDVITHPKPYDKVEETEGKRGVEMLGGEHGEELLVINQTTRIFDRDAFVAVTGAQIFWVDEGLLRRRLAVDHAQDPAEAARLHQGLMTINIAGGLTLARPELKVVVIKDAA